MTPDSFDLAVDGICEADDRYAPDAYYFLREALDFTVKSLVEKEKGKPRHVSGRELSFGIRDYANEQFGPLAALVLEQWGMGCTSDFGEIVYNLIEAGLMGRSGSDKRGDFDDVYDFDEEFSKRYEPSNPRLWAEHARKRRM